MRKILCLFLPIVIIVLLCSCSNYSEETLLKRYERDPSIKNAYNLFAYYCEDYYNDNPDYYKIAEYGDVLFVEKVNEIDSITFSMQGYEESPESSLDNYLNYYIISIAKVCDRDVFRNRCISVFELFSDSGALAVAYEESIDSYYEKTGDISLCIDLYDTLIEKSSENIIRKKFLAENKVSFLEFNKVDESLIEKAKQELSVIDKEFQTEMDKAKEKGYGPKEFIEQFE